MSLESERQWFSGLVSEYQGRLWSVAFSLCRNEQEAAEVLQEGLLSAWKARESLRDGERVLGWLCRIVANHARMRLRSRRRRPTLSIEDLPGKYDEMGHMIDPILPWSKLPDSELDRRRLVERLLGAAEGLPEGYREVWVLADVEGLGMLEIAEILEISVANVKTRLHRARLVLRAELSGVMEVAYDL